MRRLSIRARLTFWYTGILACTLLILVGVGYGLLMYSLWQDTDATLEGVAKVMAQSVQPPPTPVPPGIDELLRHFYGPSFADRFFQFLDPQGEVDPRWPQFRGGSPHVSDKALQNATEGFATFETVQRAGPFPTRVLTFPIMTRGRLVNVLQVGMSLERLHRARQDFLWAVAILIPLALVLAGTGGWLLARRALRPVDQMATTARRIGAERLTERLAGAEVDDELGRLARTLNEMLARLEAAFAQVRRFSADASHELRTPLTVLRGEIEVALRHPRSSEEYRQLLERLLGSVESMARMVDDLLLLSRADAGALRLATEPVELDRLVEEAAKEGEILARARTVRVRIQALEPLVATGDGPQLAQLLRNLVDNAVKYTPAGGQVSLALRRASGDRSQGSGTGEGPSQNSRATPQAGPRPPASGPWAEIVVQDTGIGIAPEALPRIFDRFYRADPARSRDSGGAGLGLCIARTIAEVHGGLIEVESTPGIGSTFTVRLPLRA
jgi:signal transduction histidine kinase